MKRYIVALKQDLPTNIVGISLAVFAGIVFAFFGILAIAIIIKSGGDVQITNPWYFGLPIAFAIGAAAHILARPAVRIHYKQL